MVKGAPIPLDKMRKTTRALPATGSDRSSTLVWALLLLTFGGLTIAGANRGRITRR